MLTIARLILPVDRAEALVPIGRAIGAHHPDGFDGLRARGDGIVFDVVRDPSWRAHIAAIEAFLVDHGEALASARALGASITFDVAVDPDDVAAQRHALMLAWPAPLLASLAAAGAAIEVTIYRGE